MTPPAAASPSPIPLDPRDGGALNWFDCAGPNGRVTVEFFGERRPAAPSQHEPWLIRRLRDTPHQGFFFRTLAHKGMALDVAEVLEKPSAWPESWTTRFSVPLAQLFLLPNQDPARELADLREFLTWVDVQRQGIGPEGREATIQWFRGGYRSRGLEWSGVADRSVCERLDRELALWRERPWFERWYRANMDGLAKVRIGPHCWFSLPSLVPDRAYSALRARMASKPKL